MEAHIIFISCAVEFSTRCAKTHVSVRKHAYAQNIPDETRAIRVSAYQKDFVSRTLARGFHADCERSLEIRNGTRMPHQQFSQYLCMVLV